MHDAFKVKDEEVQAKLHELGVYLKSQMPERFGFTLLMSSWGADGSMFYISSIERESSLESMKEYLIKQGKLPQDGAVPSPFVETASKVEGLPPEVNALREAGVVLIKAAHRSGAASIGVRIGGFIAFGIEGQNWEVIARRIP